VPAPAERPHRYHQTCLPQRCDCPPPIVFEERLVCAQCSGGIDPLDVSSRSLPPAPGEAHRREITAWCDFCCVGYRVIRGLAGGAYRQVLAQVIRSGPAHRRLAARSAEAHRDIVVVRRAC
jgi:hypothetical protein